MGWTFIPNGTKEQVIRECLEGWDMNPHTNTSGRVLDSACIGCELWSVVEVTNRDGQSHRFIRLDLLENQGGWGYKSMEEAMHPYYYRCPLRFLDLAPETSPEWRNAVRQHHANRLAKRLISA